jgi:hypothetical protein
MKYHQGYAKQILTGRRGMRINWYPAGRKKMKSRLVSTLALMMSFKEK